MRRTIWLLAVVIIAVAVMGASCGRETNSNTNVNTNTNQAVINTNSSVQDGLSFATAIVIEEDNEEDGIAAEYDWLDLYACEENDGLASYDMQELQYNEDYTYDVLTVSCLNGETEIYYFQIDSFFGIWE